MFKVTHDLCPEITSNVFVEGTNCWYNLCYRKDFRTLLAKSVYHETKTIAYLGPRIWILFLTKLRKKRSVKSVQELIRKWEPTNCPCRLCKVYVGGVGLSLVKIMICQPMKSLFYVTINDSSNSNMYIILILMWLCIHACFMCVHLCTFILSTSLVLGQCFCPFVFYWLTDRVPKLKPRLFLKFSTCNVRTLLRPGTLHQLTTGCKTFNIDVVAIQEHRWQTNEEATLINSNGYRFIYSTATKRSQGGVGLLIIHKIAKNILQVKSISNRILLVTTNCNPKITIICTYAPTEEASATDKDTFYNNLTDCIRDVPLHNFVVVMGDLDARIGLSNANLKTIGRHPYHKETNDNGNRLIDLCEANNACASLQQENPIQTDTSGVGSIQMVTKHN